MKLAIGSKIQAGPWGGGNQFIINLKKYLEEKKHTVRFDLKDKNIDIILLTDPRPKSSSSSFNHFDVNNYIKKNRNALVVHRINECDERKGTQGVNENLIFANKIANHTVFISSWLKDIFLKYKHFANTSVILNGANNNVFFQDKTKKIEKKLKIVTHHWSSHWNKGFEIYSHLDNLLTKSDLSNFVEFTFIGNLPKNFSFNKTNHVKPSFGTDLSNLLRENHIYITGSINEPGGNHQNEGLNCGLPVLYLNSGCMKEYCNGYGLVFEKENLRDKIFEIKDKYNEFKKKLFNYPYNSKLMCENYESLFLRLIDKKAMSNNKNIPSYSFYDKLKFLKERFF